MNRRTFLKGVLFAPAVILPIRPKPAVVNCDEHRELVACDEAAMKRRQREAQSIWNDKPMVAAHGVLLDQGRIVFIDF